MVLPFPSFSAYFYHNCRNSCCLLLRFLITFVQSSLLLLCLHHYSCFSFSHNSGLSSQVLPQFSQLSPFLISSFSLQNFFQALCFALLFFEPHVLPKVSSYWSFCSWVCCSQ